MFSMLTLDEIKVVIVGQGPYPGKCNKTNINYACGPAFLVPDNVLTCPVSLTNLFKELRREFPQKYKDMITLSLIISTVKNWIAQGVFLTNVSLTMGIDNDYLTDHKNLWFPFTVEFVKVISEYNDCPIVLLGKDAWSLSGYTKNKVLKFHHPAARDETQFLGCGMFEKINELLEFPINF